MAYLCGSDVPDVPGMLAPCYHRCIPGIQRICEQPCRPYPPGKAWRRESRTVGRKVQRPPHRWERLRSLGDPGLRTRHGAQPADGGRPLGSHGGVLGISWPHGSEGDARRVGPRCGVGRRPPLPTRLAWTMKGRFGRGGGAQIRADACAFVALVIGDRCRVAWRDVAGFPAWGSSAG